MMLNSRVPRSGRKPHQGSLSRAQFHTAIETYRSMGKPANRLVKPSTMSDNYSSYENTSRRPGRPNDVIFPPVNRTPQRSLGSPRRPTKRGTRKLPNVKSNATPQKISWYHEDGAINLEALSTLVKRQSFPRAKSYHDRLRTMNNKSWPSPSTKASHGRRAGDDGLIPLHFLNDDQLTPRKRAERDSFLATLLSVDDLTDEQLNEIAQYLIPDESEAESTPRPCLKKSPRPRSAGKTKTTNQSSQECPRPKSVHFSHSSPLPAAETCGSPRPHSFPSPRMVPKPSDPFHVASPLDSPRLLGSPDEVAYFDRLESPPEMPASPKPIPEPKVTYYNDAGEEIEEEIPEMVKASCGERNENGVSRHKASSPRPAEVESPRAESKRSSVSSSSESDPSEHTSELDTPRVTRESVATQSSPSSNTLSQGSSASVSPRPQGLSDSSESPRRSSPSRPTSSVPHDTSNTSGDDSSTPKETSPHLATTTSSDSSTEEEASLPPPTNSRPESAPTEDSPRPPRKSRPRSAKRSRSSRRHRLETTEQNNQPASEQGVEREVSSRPEHSGGASRDTPTSHDDSGCPEEDEPLPIPVISLTRGQLPPVLPRPPSIQVKDSRVTESVKAQFETKTTDSLRPEFSPRSSTLDGADSSLGIFVSSPGKNGRGKDNRMKIWLTKTAWNRHVDCAE